MFSYVLVALPRQMFNSEKKVSKFVLGGRKTEKMIHLHFDTVNSRLIISIFVDSSYLIHIVMRSFFMKTIKSPFFVKMIKHTPNPQFYCKDY